MIDTQTSKAKLIFEKQWLHLLGLVVLTTGLWMAADLNALTRGSLLGHSTSTWLRAAVGCAVLHQVIVWSVWRTQLHLGLVTRLLGRAGFPAYGSIFGILGMGRVVLVFLVAISNSGTIWAPNPPMKMLAVVIAVPALYLFYSVARYFGGKRALGLDHFDPSFRSKLFVKKGIFRFTNNGMYIYGFFILWVPVFWWGSAAAMAAAFFNHAYIWVHYFATERPDIRRIYGPSSDDNV